MCDDERMYGQCEKECTLVHNITNYVTVNDVANILLAQAKPDWASDEPEDVEDITSVCGGLNINIGTLHQSSIEGMLFCREESNELGHPVLLDPGRSGGEQTSYRHGASIMKEIKLTVIRGNISEIKTLAWR